MRKLVVLIAEELSPATVEALGPDFEIRHCDGSDRDALLAAVVDCDALLIRSATTVDAEVIAARNLHVIARAGVGLDNGRPRGHPGRRDGRERADREHRQCGGDGDRAPAGHGTRNITSANACAAVRGVAAQQVLARSCTRRRLASSAWAAWESWSRSDCPRSA